MSFSEQLKHTVDSYRAQIADKCEHLSLLRWQMEPGHRLEERDCYPGHLTTSAIILSSDHNQVLLIDHVVIGRWLQPGGHYEAAELFWNSAQREAIEETGVSDLKLHQWHQGTDLPFVIDSHDVPGKKQRSEPDHVHHDLQYLFTANPALSLIAQLEEVHVAAWKPVELMKDISPKAWRRLGGVKV
jgi:8-oxo-dGTP pyrophosphatase MutT (NUDIX family)